MNNRLKVSLFIAGLVVLALIVYALRFITPLWWDAPSSQTLPSPLSTGTPLASANENVNAPSSPPASDKSNLIRVSEPAPLATIKSPASITGVARGNWFFEASFPIRLLDANGKELGKVVAQAKGEWMTENFVPFSASLSFTQPSTSSGTLVLEKDNPSGLAEHADELRIPVRFIPQTNTVKLYYYDANKDKDETGNILCSEKGLVPAQRVLPVSQTPIQDTIQVLIKGERTKEEKAKGITTEYPLPGFELKGAVLRNGILTLEFADPQNKTSGGSCRVSILRAQMEATAKQFPEVKEVKLKPDTLFQP